MQDGTRLAAVDLGSNSYRLEIGFLGHGQIHRSEYLKETVRQGSGLDENRYLTPEAMQRGWDCLARFGELLAGFDRRCVRAVATQTLREARNASVFLVQAQELLGFPIDIISGHEEARLIYQGVAHLLPQSAERRLVIDIGGRSTELIIGQDYQAQTMESFRLGSVAWSMRYFPEGVFNQRAFEAAKIAALAILDEATQIYDRKRWDIAYGASGTVGAIGDILQAHGWPRGMVDRAGLDWLLDALLKAQRAERLRLDGLKEDRKAVIGGGLSILIALFELLKIDQMQVAEGALRHGALYDLIDRERLETDVRRWTVAGLAKRFHVDTDQATRVANATRALFEQVSDSMTPTDQERYTRKLEWAAQLHEIGVSISHSDYHKHGAYIIDHVDAAGFAMQELHRLGQLILGHRGKLKKLDLMLNDAVFVRQLLALRLGVALCHARRDPDIAHLKLVHDGAHRFALHAPSAWVTKWPQSAYLLQQESLAWQKTAWSFEFAPG